MRQDLRGRLRRLGAARWLLALLLLSACGKTDLYSRLGEREATDMMALLMRQGIDAERITAKDGTSTLQVERSRIPDAVALMKANQLPRSEYANMGAIFEQKGIVSSPVAERARLIYALSQELSRTLSDIDGVLTARVHVVLPRNDPLRGESGPSSAAVFIRHDARNPMADLLPQIKTLVAGSIEGLSYSKVAVILLPVETAERPVAPLPEMSKGGTATAALAWAPWAAMTLLPLGGGAALLVHRRRTRPEAPPAKPALVAVPPPRKLA